MADQHAARGGKGHLGTPTSAQLDITSGAERCVAHFLLEQRCPWLEHAREYGRRPHIHEYIALCLI